MCQRISLKENGTTKNISAILISIIKWGKTWKFFVQFLFNCSLKLNVILQYFSKAFWYKKPTWKNNNKHWLVIDNANRERHGANIKNWVFAASGTDFHRIMISRRLKIIHSTHSINQSIDVTEKNINCTILDEINSDSLTLMIWKKMLLSEC